MGFNKWVSINGHVTKIVIPLSPSRTQALGIAKWICILLSSICQELNSWLIFSLYMPMIFSLLCKGFSLPTCIKIWPCVDWIYIIFSAHLVYEKKKKKRGHVTKIVNLTHVLPMHVSLSVIFPFYIYFCFLRSFFGN